MELWARWKEGGAKDTPGANVIKLFTAVIYEFSQEARLCVLTNVLGKYKNL